MDKTLALIPAFQIDGDGCRTASLQIVSKDQSWWLEYPKAQLKVSWRPLHVQGGQSSSGSQEITPYIRQVDLSLHGTLHYGPFTVLRSDIIGPFRFFAGMQCSHGVISMGHFLGEVLELNGERLDFTDGIGYIGTDRGRSFPSVYLWSQCLWDGPERGRLMFAVAAILLPAWNFTGCICSVFIHGQEYRLATYRGAKIEAWSHACECRP